MRLLVFGRTGQVATELARRCPPGVDATFLGRDAADIADPDACAAAIAAQGPDAVINAAAYTQVDQAESDEAVAQTVNGDAPAAMALACAAIDIPVLHISTDYVFDGSGDKPFSPDDPVAPLGAYGCTKQAGETGVRESGARHLILRTSWVVSAHGSNFVKTMVRLGAERDHLRVVCDQVGGPTPAASIADALYVAARKLVDGAPCGTYHFAGTPDVSWAEFARTIMHRAGLDCRIEDISTEQYPTPARRPLNSRLDCTSFTREFGIERPDWRVELDAILAELGARS